MRPASAGGACGNDMLGEAPHAFVDRLKLQHEQLDADRVEIDNAPGDRIDGSGIRMAESKSAW